MLFIIGILLFLAGLKVASSFLVNKKGSMLKDITPTGSISYLFYLFISLFSTLILQSSSFVISLILLMVHSNKINKKVACYMIMGSNIGTCFTSLLTSFELSTKMLLYFIPIAYIIGKKWDITPLICGIYLIFIGLDVIGIFSRGLISSTFFMNLLENTNNPLIFLLAGLIFTGIIQSSSASIGVLQRLFNSGAINIYFSTFTLIGINVGTCVTAIYCALALNKESKDVAYFHVAFNIIGMVIFMALLIFINPQTMLTYFPRNLWIFIIHITFNVVTTLVLIPILYKKRLH